MMATNVVNNLQKDYQSLQTSQNQLDTGYAVTQPSDDPLATSQILGLNTSISTQSMYYSNMQTASSDLTITSTALSNMVSDLQQIRSLTVEGANGTESQSDLAALEQEVNQVIGNIVQVGNTANGTENYIFGGTKTNSAPLTAVTSGSVITSVSYSGNSGSINFEIAQGVKVATNINGNDLFQVSASGTSTMFETLITVSKDMLQSGASSGLSDMLSKIDSVLSNVETQQATVGAMQDRLTEAMTMNENDKTAMTTNLDNLQDVDVDQATIIFSEKSNVYQAALEVAAKVLKSSLADYLDT
jgi:flagellar hook-associated protein 3 FlgL